MTVTLLCSLDTKMMVYNNSKPAVVALTANLYPGTYFRITS